MKVWQSGVPLTLLKAGISTLYRDPTGYLITAKTCTAADLKAGDLLVFGGKTARVLKAEVDPPAFVDSDYSKQMVAVAWEGVKGLCWYDLNKAFGRLLTMP